MTDAEKLATRAPDHTVADTDFWYVDDGEDRPDGHARSRLTVNHDRTTDEWRYATTLFGLLTEPAALALLGRCTVRPAAAAVPK